MFIFKSFIKDINNKFYEGFKRECRLYNISIKYINQHFGQYFVNRASVLVF